MSLKDTLISEKNNNALNAIKAQLIEAARKGLSELTFTNINADVINTMQTDVDFQDLEISDVVVEIGTITVKLP